MGGCNQATATPFNDVELNSKLKFKATTTDQGVLFVGRAYRGDEDKPFRTFADKELRDGTATVLLDRHEAYGIEIDAEFQGTTDKKATVQARLYAPGQAGNEIATRTVELKGSDCTAMATFEAYVEQP
jgi:hypothetical protein